jgi:hypothetical protein
VFSSATKCAAFSEQGFSGNPAMGVGDVRGQPGESRLSPEHGNAGRADSATEIMRLRGCVAKMMEQVAQQKADRKGRLVPWV